jgi:hypothetical protein
VSPTNPDTPLGFEAWLDNTMIVDVNAVQKSIKVSIPVLDQNAEHVLKLVLKGKSAGHTIINSAGEIVADSMLAISDLAVDGIDLEKIVHDNAVYTHDFNGSGNTVEDQFYGTMGCNGTVMLQFSTPIYIWLLENM